MAKKRVHYSTEFKLEAIKLVESGNLTISEVARDLDVHHTSAHTFSRTGPDGCT